MANDNNNDDDDKNVIKFPVPQDSDDDEMEGGPFEVLLAPDGIGIIQTDEDGIEHRIVFSPQQYAILISTVHLALSDLFEEGASESVH